MRGVSKKYLVCREPDGTTYSLVIIYGRETWENVVDKMDGETVGVIRDEKGQTVNTTGEVVGEYADDREARVERDRLGRIASVMQS